ncbi:MAG: DUF6151 family protein [Polyangiales bacterium]
MTQVDLRCRCGALQGTLSEIAPRNATRLVCMCDDCQAFAHFLERDDVLDAAGGSDLYQVRPAHLRVTQGAEQLRCMRLSPKGLMRWYTDCCRSPVANTLDKAHVPFAGVSTALIVPPAGRSLDDVLGPPVGYLMAKDARGPAPAGAHQEVPKRVLLRIMRFLAVGLVTRKASPSPFFDTRSKQPVVTPRVLTKPERDALRPTA